MDAFVRRKPKPTSHSSQKISHPSPVDHEANRDERPAKYMKTESSSEDESAAPHISPGISHREPTEEPYEEEDDDDEQSRFNHPAIEDALPPVHLDSETIEEYEAFKASQQASSPAATVQKTGQLWTKGRSSIYVDAFNLALDTVLEDETHLFDTKELAVFNHWKHLDYEAQYLYVRLFLRKTSAWHRHDRLGYYNDISDPEAAIATLQERIALPEASSLDQVDPITGVEMEETSLNDTFTFADASDDHITTIEEAVSLLSLDELKNMAKEAKVQGKNKAELSKALCRMSYQQAGLMSVGLRRSESAESRSEAFAPPSLNRQDSNRTQHFLGRILSLTGPCVRLSPLTYELFQRVHLVFYRSTEWTEKSLTTIILAKIARRNFPGYVVCRTSNIFETRAHLLEFEAAVRLESEVEQTLEFNGPPGEEGYQKVLSIFERVYPRWKVLVAQEEIKDKEVYELGEGGYLRRFTPTHSYTRIIHKTLHVLGRLKEHAREHQILTELLDQHLFHPARRGSWYQRKALLEENYMHTLDPSPTITDPEKQKRHWKRIAIATCEAGLQDNDCHVIYHYDLQKRILKLENRLRVPFRERHHFGHVRLKAPEEHTVEGIQLKSIDPVGKNGRQPSTKTVWVDELEDGGDCTVEEMCLSSYRSKGYKGYHAEGGIIRTLFAYLFYDILFLYTPHVFQTAYQTCPLDLHTDSFYPTRASEINHRLVEIANGDAERLIREVDERERERRTCVVGLNWDYDVEDLVELVGCFDGSALATICKVMAQEYRQRGGGIPDLILWKTEPHRECMFAEVKSANDRLSDTQRLWIHVLTGAGVKVALCNAVAKEVREVD